MVGLSGMGGVGLLAVLLCLLVLSPVAGYNAAPSTASTIKRSSSAIALTGDGSTLLVVNPDSDSLSLVDVASQSLVEEIPDVMPVSITRIFKRPR